MVMSIGWNPYFNNTEKTIVSRAHLTLLLFLQSTFFPFSLSLRYDYLFSSYGIITGAMVAS